MIRYLSLTPGNTKECANFWTFFLFQCTEPVKEKINYFAVRPKFNFAEKRFSVAVSIPLFPQVFTTNPSPDFLLRPARATMELRDAMANGNHMYSFGSLSKDKGNEKIYLPSTHSLSFETDYFLVAYLTLPSEPFKGKYIVKKGGCPVLYFR